MTGLRPFRSIAAVGGAIESVIERHLETIFRHVLRGPAVTKTGSYVRLFTGEPHPFGNLSLVSDPADLAVTKAAVEPLCACQVPSAVLFPGSAVDPKVDGYLQECGYVRDSMPAMAADIEALAGTSLPDGYTFSRVGNGPEAAEWTCAFTLGYELPLSVGKLFSPEVLGAGMEPDAPLQFFAILKDSTPVCTSVVFLKDGVAGIYCVATIPEERGKGLGAHATAEPLRRAHALGYGVGVLQSSAIGHGVYRRLGFRDYGAVPMYVRMPKA